MSDESEGSITLALVADRHRDVVNLLTVWADISDEARPLLFPECPPKLSLLFG